MENLFKKRDATSLHDIKEVSKRTIQFITIALIVSSLIIPFRLYFGHYAAAASLSLFCIFCGLVWWLNKKGSSSYTKALTIIGVNAFLIYSTLSDGLSMGGYLYFFPMFFALPFLVDNHEKYTKEVAAYFVITAASIGACFIFGNSTSSWQSISGEAYRSMFIVNIFCAIFLSASFAFFSIFFERKYAKALLEEKNRTEEAMRSRSQFLSHMGHELRTPLNGIIGATNLLTKQDTLPQQDEYINILKYCSNHMLDLINNILDYNKIEADKLEIHLSELNLKQLLQNSILPFHNRFEEKKLELKLEIDERVDVVVLVDDIRLTQVLNNLISNALKFTEKGQVRLKIQCKAKSADRLEAIFSVEDTGIGIKQDDYRKIFESFEQVYSESSRKYQGTGLGLTISQRLLKLMDSQLEVKSEFGKGSTFSFSVAFRRGTEKKQVQKTSAKIEATDLSGLKVLIAEDNVINMLIATKMLEDWNITFTTAENGKQALDTLKRDSDFNLILLDLEMPEMDGYTAIKEITRLYPEVPVLAFTANLVDNEMYTNLKQMGFVDAMLKPFQPMELFSKIRYYAN